MKLVKIVFLTALLSGLLLGTTLAAGADLAIPISAERVITGTVEAAPNTSQPLLTVPQNTVFLLTQFCITENSGFVPIPPDSGLSGSGLGPIATGRCTNYEPGLAIPPGETLSCTNPVEYSSRICTITGISTPKRPQ